MDRTLILLRHAKSDWTGSEPDHDRPLAKRGRRQAPEAGQWLAEHADVIDLAVVSTATRAQQTWQLASASLRHPPSVRDEQRVYAASTAELLGLVRALPLEASVVVVVGHNPGLEDLARALTDVSVEMPTSALVVLGWDGVWASAGESPAALLASGRPPVSPPAP